MTQPANTKRPTCPRCLRPQRTCICDWITPTEHAVEVLVLQHPLEVDNAKGSARLLHLSLSRSTLAIGEIFAEAALQAMLHAPFHTPDSSQAHVEQTIKHTILLYPDSPEDPALKLSAPPALDEAILCEPAQCRLVVLDGTWRKSRKMLYLNPLLHTLPRLALRDTAASQYLIRKAHRPEQLSTLEATCYALMQLENSDEKYQPLLNAFNGFVVQQSGYRSAPREAK